MIYKKYLVLILIFLSLANVLSLVPVEACMVGVCGVKDRKTIKTISPPPKIENKEKVYQNTTCVWQFLFFCFSSISYDTTDNGKPLGNNDIDKATFMLCDIKGYCFCSGTGVAIDTIITAKHCINPAYFINIATNEVVSIGEKNGYNSLDNEEKDYSIWYTKSDINFLKMKSLNTDNKKYIVNGTRPSLLETNSGNAKTPFPFIACLDFISYKETILTKKRDDCEYRNRDIGFGDSGSALIDVTDNTIVGITHKLNSNNEGKTYEFEKLEQWNIEEINQ
jgi:hypothetical protein